MKVLFIDNTHPILKKELELNGFICEEETSKSKEKIMYNISSYDGIVIRSRFKIDSAFLDHSNNLKFIARAGSGMENIDVKYANKKGIKCYKAPDGNRQAVAEHTLGILLSLFNNISRSHLEIKKKKWIREKNRGIEIQGKKIAIIGYGNNGAAFAKLLENFGVTIMSYDKYLYNYSYKTSMKNIYKNADIVSLHVPLTPETKYLVNSKFISSFKKDIYIINTSRGNCVNTKDLVCAMKNGKILGACLDVLEFEATSFEKLSKIDKNQDLKYLLNNDQVILTPHIAGWTKESNFKIAKVLSEKILNDF